MDFYSFHGCFAEEKVIGTHFKVDVTLHGDFSEAAKNDDLSKTVNYQHVHEIVKKVMDTPSNLLEHLCHRILNRIREQYPELSHTEVTVYKLNPSIGGKTDWVAVNMAQ